MRRLKLAFDDLRELTRPPGVSRELSSYGVVEVPRFMSSTWSAELQAVVNGIYHELAAANEAGQEAFLADKELAYHFTAWRGVLLERLSPYLTATNADIAQALARLLDHVRDQVHAMFGPTWRLIPNRSWFRRHVGTAIKVPWHIDADAAAINGFGRKAFNVWMPLEPVGRDLPSLDVIRGSHRTMRKLPLLEAPNLYRDDEFVSEMGEISSPCLMAGDALIFDQYTLHRTQPIGSADTLRTACEFRFAR
jgi:hypothetical protein